MAGLVDDGKNALLNGLASSVAWVSLHTDDPGLSGSAEVTGGAYTRETATWAAASAASVSISASIVFDVPGSTTIDHLGYWSASTAGTFFGSRALDTAQTYATAGTYTIASGNITESIT